MNRKHFPEHSADNRIPLAHSMLRFVVVGLAATTVHFCILIILREFAMLHIGLANAVASAFGLLTSYMGNSQWVFPEPTSQNHERTGHNSQIFRFLVLYAVIALFHGFALWSWTLITDVWYGVGFIFVTFFAAIATYVGNRFFVFVPRKSQS